MLKFDKIEALLRASKEPGAPPVPGKWNYSVEAALNYKPGVAGPAKKPQLGYWGVRGRAAPIRLLL
jgi:hypothetical protein